MCVPSARAMTFITFFQGSVFVATWMAFPTAVCMFTGQTQTSYDSHAACSLSNTHQKKKKYSSRNSTVRLPVFPLPLLTQEFVTTQ